MSFTPPMPGPGENLTQFDLMMGGAQPPAPPGPNVSQFDLMMMGGQPQPQSFDYNSWAQGAGMTPGQRPNSVAGSTAMPTTPTPAREIGFAPGMGSEGGATMPAGDPINIDPTQYQQSGERSSAMDYAGKLQELAYGKDPSMGRDKRRALSDALAIFGAKMIGDKPTTVAGKIFGAVAPAIVGFNASEAQTDERVRKERATQADDLLKALQLKNQDEYRRDSLDLREKLGLMQADNRSQMADIRLALGQAGIDQKKEADTWRRNNAAEALRYKREKLDADIKNDAETLKIRMAEAAARNGTTPFDRQMAIDKAANDYWKTLGLDRPADFYGEDYNATKEVHRRYVDGLQKWVLTDPATPGQQAPATVAQQPGKAGPKIGVGATAVGPNGARLRWDGTEWQRT